jgi:hypothetical protein
MTDPDTTEENWKIVTEYCPDLVDLDLYLRTLSEEIASDFRARLLATKAFNQRHELARQMEADFLTANFGRNEAIVEFGRKLIQSGHKRASSELSRTVPLLGDDFDPDVIIARIRQKYSDIQVKGDYASYSDLTGNLRRPGPQDPPHDIAKRLLVTKSIDDAEDMIKALGGAIFKRQINSNIGTHTAFVLQLDRRREVFNTLDKLTQWVINEVAIPIVGRRPDPQTKATESL